MDPVHLVESRAPQERVYRLGVSLCDAATDGQVKCQLCGAQGVWLCQLEDLSLDTCVDDDDDDDDDEVLLPSMIPC